MTEQQTSLGLRSERERKICQDFFTTFYGIDMSAQDRELLLWMFATYNFSDQQIKRVLASDCLWDEAMRTTGRICRRRQREMKKAKHGLNA